MIALEGLGLHEAKRARVTLRPSAGPTTVNGTPLPEWRPVAAERSTMIACESSSVRTVEHLFAALAGLHLHRGVAIDIEGPEVPILDGASARWMDAAASLRIDPSAPACVVVREGEVRVATSVYGFTPAASSRVSVALELGDARLIPEATWDGDAGDFRRRVASARTFCFAHEVEALAARGLAQHVTPELVVVLGPTILAHGAPFTPDEPARHKLLDLVGDLFLHGGPPRGAVHAYRPGHAATHEAMRVARERGILATEA